MLYRLVMAGRTPSSRRGRGRPRKHGLPPAPRTPPTTSTTPASTTSAGGSSVPPSPYTQEFVMIPNPGYHNSEPQPLFLQQASSHPPPPLGGEACGQPASTPSPSQPGLQGA